MSNISFKTLLLSVTQGAWSGPIYNSYIRSDTFVPLNTHKVFQSDQAEKKINNFHKGGYRSPKNFHIILSLDSRLEFGK